jgi:hypothetical protein
VNCSKVKIRTVTTNKMGMFSARRCRMKVPMMPQPSGVQPGHTPQVLELRVLT